MYENESQIHKKILVFIRAVFIDHYIYIYIYHVIMIVSLHFFACKFALHIVPRKQVIPLVQLI